MSLDIGIFESAAVRERASEVHHHQEWNDLIHRQAKMCEAMLDLLTEAYRQRDAIESKTAIRCRAMVGCSCGASQRIKEEFNL